MLGFEILAAIAVLVERKDNEDPFKSIRQRPTNDCFSGEIVRVNLKP